MSDKQTIRIRHENARRRTLTVKEKRQLAPHYLSIVFSCDDFGEFMSAAPDDHIKLFLPGDGPDAAKRDYTPRSFDPEKNEFVIEFALHDNPGPATSWAVKSMPGDSLEIGGPRGSAILPADFDWYWLIGDETAIPAIARRLGEQPSSNVMAMIAVARREEQVELPVKASQSVIWVHRPVRDAASAEPLLAAVARQEFPSGDGFVWIAAEAGVARALREALLARNLPLSRLKARGYWTSGAADKTASFD